MYLTDYREQTLKDVITKLEPEVFKKVTGLTKDDFELLLSLNVFNSARMNDAVYKFKRYEDDSLSYAGIDKHEGENAVLAVVPRSGLPAGGIVVGVLRHPQTTIGTHVSGDLWNERGGHVDQRPYAGALVDSVDEHADPVGIAPCRVAFAQPQRLNINKSLRV